MQKPFKPTRANISRDSIQRLYISMRHLFLRGSYKPLGASGEAMINAMLNLQPEIYGSIGDPERVELSGLLYIFQRLPQGIEECRYVKMIGREGYANSGFDAIIPSKRRRNCYRIDEEQMYIEMTRGRSDIYDVLTHLTFMYIEAEKIRRNALDSKNRMKREWKMLGRIIEKIKSNKPYNKKIAYAYLSVLLGRTLDETLEACDKFEKAKKVNSLFNIVYWLGQRSIEEETEQNDRQISFSAFLQDVLGKHMHGENWAGRIKKYLVDNKLHDRPVHIISSNMHSVRNAFFAKAALGAKKQSIETVAQKLSLSKAVKENEKVRKYALKHGMTELLDESGTNINVQIFDCSKIAMGSLKKRKTPKSKDVIVVMDYAFGEQAFESMDELLKPYENGSKIPINIVSISVMGKAGTLAGQKGDIMVPNAHIFEGSADNYTFKNQFDSSVFKNSGLKVFKGPMITVLGTSLQNKDILRYFHLSSWGASGLEMEGAHYQKAIQAASQIRNSIKKSVVLRYAYYASDNPLHSGSTLASGGLGVDGVKPTYLITTSILQSILN